MTTKTLTIRRLRRLPQSGPEDELLFSAGVNVIVGRPNTGKTRWLRMLDYLMGDPAKPEDAFGSDLVEKYASIEAVVVVDDDEILIERRWKQVGARGKVFIDGQSLPAEHLSRFLLERLGIPILEYPQGNPYSERRWQPLSWRSLFRHIYRQQRFWADIADKQPESEQHACLMVFLGVAEHIFSPLYGELVAKRKELYQREGAKQQFTALLEGLARELVDDENLQVAITPQSIDTSMARLREEIEGLERRRSESLASLLRGQNVKLNGHDSKRAPEIDQLADEWVRLQADREHIVAHLGQSRDRLRELEGYRSEISSELARLSRAKVAGRVLAPLKVTTCPECNQAVEHLKLDAEPGCCFLCRQSLRDAEGDADANERRFKLEEQQLASERKEVDDLIREITQERENELQLQRRVEADSQHVATQLHVVRQAVASILPPELTIWDMDRGRAEERIRQLERLRSTLDLREQMSIDIDTLREEVSRLDGEVDALAKQAHTEQASDVIANGMNTYLNALKANDAKAWTQEAVRVRIRERSFGVTVGGDNWSGKLGGTMTLYFLLSYHYALLSLSLKPIYHYPGLVILDLPATLDEVQVSDEENYILEPFVQLTAQPEFEGTQVIAAGAAFEGLKGVNRIVLDRVWR